MKIGHLLYVSGLNREAFNTLRRRGYLEFLKKHVGKGADRFGPWHALALAAFSYFRRINVETPKAAEAIAESWPDIVRVAGLIDEEPRSALCGIRINDLNVEDTFGWPHPASKGEKPVAFAAVDLRVLWDWIQPMIADTARHTDADEGDEA